MRWIPLLTLTALAFVSFGASACDLAGPVPGPGHFFIFDVETGAEVDVPIEGRWLGAGCELSNRFAFDGENLVWMEGPERSDAAQTLRLRASDGTIRTLSTDAEGHHRLGLTSTHLYFLSGTFAAPTLNAHRLSDGHTNVVSTQVAYHAALNGAIAAWVTSDGKRLSVYDAEQGDWILRDKGFSQLGVPSDDQGPLFAFDDEFLFFSTYLSTKAPTTFRYWMYETSTGSLEEVGDIKDPYGVWIDSETVYFTKFDTKEEGHRLFGFPATGATSRDLGMLPHGLGQGLVVVGTQVVLASYAHEAMHSHAPRPDASGWESVPGPPGEPWTVPSVDVAWLLAAIGSVFVVVHRSRP